MRHTLSLLLLSSGMLGLGAISVRSEEKTPMPPIIELPPPTLNPKSPELAPLDKLKSEREKLNNELKRLAPAKSTEDETLALERAKLRIEIVDLLNQIETKKNTPVAPPKIDSTPKTKKGIEKIETPDLSKSLDPLNQAKSLYLAKNFDAAMKAFSLIDTSTLAKEDRAFVQYMLGSCQRRMGNLKEAAALYREVASADEDEFIKECAVWQLANLRWREELETQLDDLRGRLKNR